MLESVLVNRALRDAIIVLNFDDIRHKQYLEALAGIINPDHIKYVSRISENTRIHIVITNNLFLSDDITKLYISIAFFIRDILQGKHFPVSKPYDQSPKKPFPGR